MRRVYQPQLDDSFGAVPIDNGGSSSKKLETAVQYLGLLTNASKGVALGTADLDASGKVKHAVLPDSIISEVVNVTGPSSLKISQTGIYTITDYDSATTYTIAATAGVVSRNGDTITYTAAATPGNGGFTLNGKSYIIPVTYYAVVTPNITSPTNGQTGLSGTVSFTSNSFAMEGGTDTHATSDWQLSTVSDFATLVSSVTDSSGNKTTWSATGLNPNTTYYARVRYKATVSGYSAWSPVISFSTAVSFAPNAPSFTNPTNGQTNVALSSTFTASAFSSPGVDTHYSSDWQIATDAGFSNIIKSATDDTVNKTSWPVTGLVDLTVYYARVRYKGANFGYGNWSTPVSFTTIQANSINTPSVTSPANATDGVSLSPTLTSSAFSVTGGSDTHQSTDWQIATDSGFTNIVKSTTGDTVNKTSWSVTGLTPGLIYYVRVRYKGAALPYSAWSTTSHFGTIHLNTPSITSPTTGATGLMPSMTLSGSAFGVTGASDTHASSTWQIATDPGFTNIAVESVNSTTNKTSWTVNLNLNTTYYARVRYTGTTYGTSNWSSTISFSTVANYTPNTPSITSPTSGATNQGPVISFTSSAFAMNGGSATHTSSDWQIATDSGFATIVSSATDDTVNKVSWNSASLAANTTFYARVRYKASNGIYSAWSTTVTFTTKSVYIPTTEETIIPGPSGSAGFGYYIDMDQTGTRVVIGAGDSINTSVASSGTSGKVFVYVRSGSTWTLEQTITPQRIIYGAIYDKTQMCTQYEQFGRSVAITPDGTRIVVGAPGHNYWQSTGDAYGYGYYIYGTGRAVVFVRSGSTWTQEGSTIYGLVYGIEYSNSGHSVAISDAGDRVIVGAPNYKWSTAGADYTNAGMFTYWTRSGSSWSYKASYQGSISANNMYLGQGIAISGDGTRCIVGIPGADQCRVFTLSTSAITFEATISSGYYGGQLGYFADMNADGSVAVAGGYAYDSSKGRIVIARRTGTTWSTSVISPASLVVNDYFGRGVCVSPDGNMIVVGAMQATRQSLSKTGSVYIFTWNGSTWEQNAEFQASDPAANAYYGRVVALSGDKTRLLVGNEIRNKCYVYK